MNRGARRMLAREMRSQARAWPEHLAEVPKSEWPERRDGHAYPLAVWRSCRYLAVVYPAPSHGMVEARRISVNRVTIGASGHWDQDIPWEDLMGCKRETGHADWYGVEVYPRACDVVNVANMRHLWLFAEPLDIGWFAGEEAP